MAYQDIERWKEMSKGELYQELVGLYGDVPPVDDITYIYVNNCYELSAQICKGYLPDCFRVLYPKESAYTPSFRQQGTPLLDFGGKLDFLPPIGPKDDWEYLP